MSYDEERWRRDRDYGRGDVDRDLLESSRRLEQRHDYNPDLIRDMRAFAGAGELADTRHADTRESDVRSVDTRYRDAVHGDRYERRRGVFSRGGDDVASWTGDEDAERRRRMDALRGDRGARHHRGVGPRGYSRSDERIREDVCERLTDDPYVDATDIEVVAGNGEITLSGTVDSRAARRRAEDIAESISGVTHVQNNLRVGAGASASGTSAR